MDELKVPVIDLSLDDETLGKLFYEACSTTGVFYISNHGISKSFVDGYFSEMKRAFGLPFEEKMKLVADENNWGYVPIGKEILDRTRGVPDRKEGFTFGRDSPDGSDELKLPFHGQNRWLDEALLPGFRKATEEYLAAMTALFIRLLGFLEIALGVPKDFFVKCFDRPVTHFRIFRYAPEICDPKNGVFAAGPHRDFGLASILANDGLPGLQLERDGIWTDVPPIPETFTIVIGDLLERWTNGKFKSTLHRVVNMEGKERFCTALFCEPTFDTLVEVIPGCCDGQPPKHPPITAGEHLLLKSSGHVFAGGVR